MAGKLYPARSDVKLPDMRYAKWIAIRWATVPHSRLSEDMAHAHKQRLHDMATVYLKTQDARCRFIHIAFVCFVPCLSSFWFCFLLSSFGVFSHIDIILIKYIFQLLMGERGSVVVKGLMLQPGRSRVRYPMRLFFLIYLILPAALGPGVYSASNRNEY
jgi:hypothetical protein